MKWLWRVCACAVTHAYIHMNSPTRFFLCYFLIKTVNVDGLCRSTLDSTTHWHMTNFTYIWLFTLDLKIGCFTVKIHFFYLWVWVWILFVLIESSSSCVSICSILFLQCNILKWLTFKGVEKNHNVFSKKRKTNNNLWKCIYMKISFYT